MNLKAWAGRMAGDMIKEGPLPVFNKYIMGIRTFADCAVEAIESLIEKENGSTIREDLQELRKAISKAETKIRLGEDAEAVFKELIEEIKELDEGEDEP